MRSVPLIDQANFDQIALNTTLRWTDYTDKK
jgi:hypothetical protein